MYLPLFLRKLHKSTFSLDRASLINETNFKFTLVVGISKAASGLLVGFKVTPHTSLKMKVSNQFLAWSNFQEMFGMLFALPTPVVDVMKLFLRKSKKSPKLIKTRIRYLKAKNSFIRVSFKSCIVLSFFCSLSDIRANFFQIVNVGKARFPPKRFYNINCWTESQLILCQILRKENLWWWWWWSDRFAYLGVGFNKILLR